MSFIKGLTDKIQQTELYESASNALKDLDQSTKLGQTYAKLDPEKVKQLVYPQNLFAEDGLGHFIMFNINRIGGSKFQDRTDYVENPTAVVESGTAIEINRSQNSLRKHSFRNYKRSEESIILQMPQQITATYGTDWAVTKLGTAGSAINAGTAILNGQFSASGLAKAAAKSAAQTALKVVDVITPGNLEDATQLLLGEQSNPYVEVLFKSTNRRDFPFQFTFTPKNNEESRLAHEIIRRFKFHMHAELKSGATSSSYLASPSTFDITFMTSDGRNQWLNKISTCALATCQVNYVGGERYAVHDDDSPAAIVVDCVFVELEVLTKQRFANNGDTF